MKHTNSILKSFEYFCQISAKLILTILSYTVSKFVHFWDTVYIYWRPIWKIWNGDISATGHPIHLMFGLA